MGSEGVYLCAGQLGVSVLNFVARACVFVCACAYVCTHVPALLCVCVCTCVCARACMSLCVCGCA